MDEDTHLIYLTARSFPGSTADHVSIRQLSQGFARALPGRFTLVVNQRGAAEDLPLPRVVELGLGRHFRTIRLLSMFPRLHRSLSRAGMTRMIYFSNDPYILLILCLYTKLVRGYEICANWHHLNGYVIDAIVGRIADFHVCNTAYLRSHLTKRYRIQDERSLVSPQAIDLEVFKRDPEQALQVRHILVSEGKILLGYFGRFTTMSMDKGIDSILRTLALLDDRYVFLAAGGYPADIARYEQAAREAGVSDRVIFKGESSQRELALFEQACDILLMPFPFNEHYAYMMSAMKMFEYMASGTAIIATDLPSITEVLSENNALLIPPDDDQALASAIKKLSEDPAWRTRIAERAFVDIQTYTWTEKARTIASFLRIA